MKRAPLPPEAAWPDQLTASRRVWRRVQTANHARGALDTFEQRELDRLLRQNDPTPADGAIALALLKTLFDRRGDRTYLTRLTEALRSVVVEGDGVNADANIADLVSCVSRQAQDFERRLAQEDRDASGAPSLIDCPAPQCGLPPLPEIEVEQTVASLRQPRGQADA